MTSHDSGGVKPDLVKKSSVVFSREHTFTGPTGATGGETDGKRRETETTETESERGEKTMPLSVDTSAACSADVLTLQISPSVCAIYRTSHLPVSPVLVFFLLIISGQVAFVIALRCRHTTLGFLNQIECRLTVRILVNVLLFSLHQSFRRSSFSKRNSLTRSQ